MTFELHVGDKLHVVSNGDNFRVTSISEPDENGIVRAHLHGTYGKERTLPVYGKYGIEQHVAQGRFEHKPRVDFDGFTRAVHKHDDVRGYAGTKSNSSLFVGLDGVVEDCPLWLIDLAAEHGFAPCPDERIHGEYDPLTHETNFAFRV